MSHSILLTGASGYLGGTVLARWKEAKLPSYSHFYTLVRSTEQGDQVKQYGAEPLLANLNDPEDLAAKIVDLKITIVYLLVDAYSAKHQPVHFLNTTGTKQFSRHAGMPTDLPLLDTNPDLYELQKTAKGPHEFIDESVRANVVVIDSAERHGVRSYIFAPCLVYGRGEGFGNKTSIQDVSIVQAAQGAGRVCAVDSDNPTWPVCHIEDTATLYLQILRKILCGEEIGYGRNGYYLASSGPIAWNDVYKAFAKSLYKRNQIEDDKLHQADQEMLRKMGNGLGVESDQVQVLMGGKSLFTAEHGYQIGWKLKYAPEHILEVADEEVELILGELERNKNKANIR